MEKVVAPQIKELREQSKLTQEDVARKLNMSRSNYAKIESGEVPVTCEKIAILAKLYDVDYNYLFNETSKTCVCKYKYQAYMREQKKLFERLFK